MHQPEYLLKHRGFPPYAHEVDQIRFDLIPFLFVSSVRTWSRLLLFIPVLCISGFSHVHTWTNRMNKTWIHQPKYLLKHRGFPPYTHEVDNLCEVGKEVLKVPPHAHAWTNKVNKTQMYQSKYLLKHRGFPPCTHEVDGLPPLSAFQNSVSFMHTWIRSEICIFLVNICRFCHIHIKQIAEIYNCAMINICCIRTFESLPVKKAHTTSNETLQRHTICIHKNDNWSAIPTRRISTGNTGSPPCTHKVD